MTDEPLSNAEATAAAGNAVPLPAKSARTSSPRSFGGLPAPENFQEGKAAGIERDECWPDSAPHESVVVTCIDYSPSQVQVQDVTANLKNFLAHHRPAWSTVRWINIDGVNNPTVIQAFAEKYDLHPLAIEDVVHIPQRPKVDDYPGCEDHIPRLFVIVRMLRLTGEKLSSEQISMFVGRHTLLTFQERPGDVWDPTRQRINTSGSRVRASDTSFLLYTLLDAVVDQFFPILEHFSDRLEDLEEQVLLEPSHETIEQVHTIKRELLLLRRAAWPMRDAIHVLQREPHECLCDTTRTYLRDVYDHTIQIIDLVETYREFSASLTETYMSSISQRMNEIMKVLTIMGTIFIPLTFLAGVYGMNMKIPEAQYSWMYPTFWVICIVTAVGMLSWFKRRGWL